MKTTVRTLVRIAALVVLAAWPPVALANVAGSAPVPEVSIALRGLVEDTLEQGEPLRVTVRLESSGEGSGRVELAPATGTWVDAVAVELLPVSGGTVFARGTAVGAPASPRTTIDRERIAGGMWMFPTSVTQGLAPGDYLVRARLDLKAGAGWTGEVTSEDAPLSIVEVSQAPERVSARTFARVQILFLQGELEEAARQLDAVLVESPDDLELLCLRADVALAGGNPAAAMICLGRAVRRRSPDARGPPPPILHDVQSRVLAAQLASASPGEVPAWTWPPLAVLKLSEEETAELLEESRSAPAATSSAEVQPTAPASSSAPASTAPQTLPVAPVSPGSVAVGGTSAPARDPAVTPGPSIGTLVSSAGLSEEAIRAERDGQWATGAVAGSQYGRTTYSAAQATGAPNVPVAGNSPDAWCPANRDTGVDWLEVTFAKPVHATELRVRQNDAAGAITGVEAISPDGTAHVWWEGVDPYQRPAVREIVWFAVRVPKTAYLVERVKLTLNLASGPGYKQIDAVQLVGVP